MAPASPDVLFINTWTILCFNQLTSIKPEEAVEIEYNTRGQGLNKYWREQRELRMTSSNFGVICKATERRDKLKLAKSLIMSCELKVPAVCHGHKYEPVAIEKYEKSTGLETKECGLFISHINPMLAALPDRIVNSAKIVKVKCPFSAKNKPINPVNVPYLKMNNGQLMLDKKHNYYYQIQGQLYCADRQTCDLVICTVTDMKIIPVKHVHRLELQKFFNFCAAHSPVRLDIETNFPYFLFLTWLSIIRTQEFRLYI